MGIETRKPASSGSSSHSSYSKTSSSGPRTSGPPRTGGFKRGGARPVKKRICRVCADKKGYVDWKAANFLRNYVTDNGKIMSARSRGTCSICQRAITRAIKRARVMSLLPFFVI